MCLVELEMCCDILTEHSDFIPHQTWGSLIGDKYRYKRKQWDEKHCNQLIGSKDAINCKGNSSTNYIIITIKIMLKDYNKTFHI